MSRGRILPGAVLSLLVVNMKSACNTVSSRSRLVHICQRGTCDEATGDLQREIVKNKGIILLYNNNNKHACLCSYANFSLRPLILKWQTANSIIRDRDSYRLHGVRSAFGPSLSQTSPRNTPVARFPALLLHKRVMFLSSSCFLQGPPRPPKG